MCHIEKWNKSSVPGKETGENQESVENTSNGGPRDDSINFGNYAVQEVYCENPVKVSSLK